MKNLLLVLLEACVLILGSQAWAWRATINGTSTDSNLPDQVYSVTVDSTGNVVAAGYMVNTSVSSDFTVIKLDGGNGIELWRRMIDGTANGPDLARAVKTDREGNVVAAGTIKNAATGDDFSVIKLHGDSGAELWRQMINGTTNGPDEALAVALDNSDNVVAAGFTINATTGSDFTVIKFDGVSGAELWRQVINGTGNGPDQALAVTIDAEGNVLAAGYILNIGTFDDFIVIKFDGATGTELWRQVINLTATSRDRALALAVDGGGNLVATGFSDWGSHPVILVKFDGTSGTELWRQLVNFGTALSIAVDAAGNVVAAGEVQNPGTSYDFTVIKFDGTSGAELWRRMINGTANGADQARAVGVDGTGNVLAAGVVWNAGTSFDFTVVKLDGDSGVELWRRMINGTANAADQARALALDGMGNVVAAGATQNVGTSDDITIMKLAAINGTELWRNVASSTIVNADDEGLAVAIDGAGNVVAGGVTRNSGTLEDFTVIKFDGVSGTELWRQTINGTADGDDQVLAVAVDSSGNVVAAGDTQNTGTLFDFTVVKFDGANGTELWRRVINGTENLTDQAFAVTVDAAEDVIAAGYTLNTGSRADFTVVKLNGISGAELWRQVIAGTANQPDHALAVTVDGAADVIAGGYINNSGTFADFTVVKFDRLTGTELWRQLINGTANSADQAFAVTVDAAGNVIAAGSIANTGTGEDFTVVKFHGLSGTELWRQVFDVAGNRDDRAFAVTVDGEGNVFASGGSGCGLNPRICDDFVIIKLNGSSGEEVWRQIIRGTAYTATTHNDGNVVAAGYIRSPDGRNFDFTVLKFDGATGLELWRHVTDGDANDLFDFDMAFAVRVDPLGDVLTAGFTTNLETRRDFTVVKLRGADGGDF